MRFRYEKIIKSKYEKNIKSTYKKCIKDIKNIRIQIKNYIRFKKKYIRFKKFKKKFIRSKVKSYIRFKKSCIKIQIKKYFKLKNRYIELKNRYIEFKKKYVKFKKYIKYKEFVKMFKRSFDGCIICEDIQSNSLCISDKMRELLKIVKDKLFNLFLKPIYLKNNKKNLSCLNLYKYNKVRQIYKMIKNFYIKLIYEDLNKKIQRLAKKKFKYLKKIKKFLFLFKIFKQKKTNKFVWKLEFENPTKMSLIKKEEELQREKRVYSNIFFLFNFSKIILMKINKKILINFKFFFCVLIGNIAYNLFLSNLLFLSVYVIRFFKSIIFFFNCFTFNIFYLKSYVLYSDCLIKNKSNFLKVRYMKNLFYMLNNIDIFRFVKMLKNTKNLTTLEIKTNYIYFFFLLIFFVFYNFVFKRINS